MTEPGKSVSPQLQAFLQQEQQRAALQQTVAKLTETCWDKCISSPGSYLGSREEACLQNCAKRFLEATQLVIQRFQQKSGGADGQGF